MDIVFSINKLGMEGLGATLSSMVRNCSDSRQLKLWFFCSGLFQNDKDNIKQLLEKENFQGISEYVDFDAKKLFGHLRSLHGDWTTYGRLLIPETIPSDSAVYLDSDLIIDTDILTLKNYPLDDCLAAVNGSTVSWAIEYPFLINKLKISGDSDYFNAGVLVFNILMWKEKNIDEEVKKLSAEHPMEFLCADQTLLNALCRGKFTQLPGLFNTPCYAGVKNTQYTNGNAIIHFVGSPKPWDLFGKNVHSGFNLWKKYHTTFWQSKYGGINLGKIERTWKIKKSLIKAYQSKLSVNNNSTAT